MEEFLHMDMFTSDSDCERYSEATESEDQDDGESLYVDHAQNILSSLEESIGKIDNFLSFERGFVHGDIICSSEDPSGQMGRIVNVDTIVDLETCSGKLIKNVNSKKLLKVRSFASGDYVVHGLWLGKVAKVFDVVTIVFSDGAKCEIMTGGTEVLVPISPSLCEDMPYLYYPGQHVRIETPTISKSSRWLCSSWKGNRDEGIVCNVEVGLVHVNWIAPVTIHCNAISPPSPPTLQSPQVLTLLSCFPYAEWQLGDWCTLSHNQFTNVQTVHEKSTHFDGLQYLTKMPNNFPMNDGGCKQMFVIARTRARVDVLWQNGNLSVGLDPQTLYPVNSIGEHDFWPEQFVLEKGSTEDMKLPSVQRLGVVKSVDAQEQTVKVKWIVSQLNQTEVVSAELNEETVSAYELIEHPDFSFCIGDVVFRRSPHFEDQGNNLPDCQANEQRQLCPLPSNSKLSCSVPLVMDLHGIKHNEGHCEYDSAYLSYVGNVIGFKDEGIEVRWANGLTCKVHPSEIYGLDRHEDSASILTVNEEANLESISKHTAEQEKLSLHKRGKVATDSSNDWKKDAWDASAFLFPCAAVGFFTNVAKCLFKSHGSSSLPGQWQELSTEEMQQDVGDQPLENLNQQADADKLKEQPPIFPGSDKAQKFQKFDVVDDYSDHHFVNGMAKGSTLSQVKRGWLKKVHEEWSILEKNLPDSIYVRVYEERINLLRAAIIGAPGTPYHDGLFFFDIFIPPDYPHEPPLVHYNSGGLQLNPNLYESGKVCLSLLNTWMGSGTEVWSPESSTILQVLLSLQALVLNDKPYFNEAGYDKQVGRAEGEKNSITYNENAFLLSLKSMLYILRNPPKHFEAFVEDHFAKRLHSILMACKSYTLGAQVGYPFESEKETHEDHKSCSTGFKIMLMKLIPKLISAFTEKGIDCGQFLDQIHRVDDPGEGGSSFI